ncbi:MAG: chemotaxis protein CheW [Planctomycetes bacterium]|nr:chemotaxis protein CheW [Planctomycetota bacterium]
MEEIIREFLIESHENLEQVDLDLLALEENPNDREILNRIFRTVHTIKGTCGFLEFHKLERLTHVGENLLDRLRDGTLDFEPDIANALLAMIDATRTILAAIDETQAEGQEEYPELIARLEELQSGTRSEPPKATTITAETAGPVSEVPADEPAPSVVPAAVQAIEIDLACDDEAPTAVAPERKPETATSTGAKRGSGVGESTIRVDVGLLDKLMNLVGELVLARNQILQHTSHQEDSGLLATSQRLNLITTELQELFMRTRMQSMATVWNKYPRVIRDLAKACGKSVKLEMEGKDTECDKTLIEAIKDPLTHVLRNCVDHGIEPSERRVANGKSAEGTILLRAFHEGGSVIIEVSDDGGGLNTERIKKKAVERGLITPEEAEEMTERAAQGLIFRAGFSTAETVSNVSGRGVGMDVVKTNIARIGGKTEIHSVFGEGTTLRIKIPLTLAIVPALTVTSCLERFAIPQLSLVELVRIEAHQVETAIEFIQGAPVYRLRGRLLPLVFLNEVLGKRPIDGEPHPLNIVVLQADAKTFGLVVDEVNDTQEIVVKPVGKHLKGIPVFAGATILGDGRVALILDVLGLALRARVLSEVRDHGPEDGGESSSKSSRSEERETLLIFSSPDDGRMAVPISKIARLEEIPVESTECTGSVEVVQYRGQIMPLFHVSSLLPERRSVYRSDPADESEHRQVLVYRLGAKSVGLVVERIVDIVAADIDTRGSSTRHGVLGTAVIQDRVTELLDIDAVIREAWTSIYGELDVFEEELVEA